MKDVIRKSITVITIIAMALTLAMPMQAEAKVKVKLNKTEIALNVKKSYNLKVAGTTKKVIWSTSKKSVATVNSKGKITAKKKGTATITAKVSGKKYTCKVTVRPPVTSVTLNKKTATLTKKGATVTLKATAKPTNANQRKVTWKSNNTKVAKVDSNGKVSAVSNGTATITATAADGSKKKAACKVTVKNAGTGCKHDWWIVSTTVDGPLYCRCECGQIFTPDDWQKHSMEAGLNRVYGHGSWSECHPYAKPYNYEECSKCGKRRPLE